MPPELSGGQRKRVGLARALIDRPEILLYDEPTTGLDPVATKNVDEMIRRTADEFGVTSVVISHDMASTFRIGDRISMLYNGQDRRQRHAAGGAGQPASGVARVRRDLGAGRARSRTGRHEAELGVAHGRRAGARDRSCSAYFLVRLVSEQDAVERGLSPSTRCSTTRPACSRSRGCRPPASRSARSKSASSTRRREGQDHDPHRARHHAVRKRRRDEEVGVAAGRVLPGDRSRAPEEDGRRPAAGDARVLKDGDQIMNVHRAGRASAT